MQTPKDSPTATNPRFAWIAKLPTLARACVAVALVVLTITPMLMVNRITSAVEANATIFEPAHRHERQLRLLFQTKIAELRAYLLTGDPSFLAGYRAARTAEEETFENLSQLASRIGPDAEERLDSVRQSAARWHVWDDALAEGQITLEEYEEARLPEQRALQAETFAAAARLGGEIGRAAVEYRQTLGAEMRRQRSLALALGVVALLAAIAVGWFARRERALTRALAKAVEAQSRLRRQAEQRREELERVTESRARLMRGFSHDVKNPLGAADGYLQLFEDGIFGSLTPKQLEQMGKARRSLGSALRLIEDLVGLARAETGQIEIEAVPTDVGAVVRDAADEYRAQAERKGLAMAVDVSEDVPSIRSDPERIRQVLGNLVSNAVKYTPEGIVTVRLTRRDGGGAPRAGRWIAVDVADTGPGIPAEQLTMLFQEFTRLAPEAGPGAGIGLSISRRIARALGGEVTVESEIGRGSTFTLWLPDEAEERVDRAG